MEFVSFVSAFVGERKRLEDGITLSETAKLDELRIYYYFKHLLPWAEELPKECRKSRR